MFVRVSRAALTCWAKRVILIAAVMAIWHEYKALLMYSVELMA